MESENAAITEELRASRDTRKKYEHIGRGTRSSVFFCVTTLMVGEFLQPRYYLQNKRELSMAGMTEIRKNGRIRRKTSLSVTL
jgi:hypothetical protein